MDNENKQHQPTHELGRIYDAITDSKVLSEFFLTSALQFLSAEKGYIFLVGQNKKLWLDIALPAESLPPAHLAHEAEQVFLDGKPITRGGKFLLPLIAHNGMIGVACFERAEGSPELTSKELEFGFNLASEFSGALKSNLLFEENMKMERLAAVGQTLGMVIHEIKNIMQLARFSDEMLRMGIKEKNEKFVEKGLFKMKKTLGEMDGLIWEMLSLTKDYKIEPQKMDVAAILVELAADLEERAQKKYIQLDFQVDPGFPEVEGDSRSIYRALLNLAKNAMEAFSGKPDACVRIRARHQSDNFYELVVEDNASGMTEEVRARLFEAFFSTKGSGGTGLGLMVVARTAKMHNGDVRVESKLGEGTKFFLTLARYFPQ